MADRVTSKVAAWAWAMTPDDVQAHRQRFPGLRIVHYPGTYSVARAGDVCLVDGPHAAERAVAAGVDWAHAILGDEPNVDGLTPEAYVARMRTTIATLAAAGIPWSPAGLAMTGGHFPRDYHDALLMLTPGAALHAVHGRVYRLRRMLDGLARDGQATRWSVTLLPLRLNWWPLRYLTLGSWLREILTWPGFPQALRLLEAHPQVDTVGLWCLQEGRMGDGAWQGYHGLIDRHGRMTRVGRIVQRYLAG